MPSPSLLIALSLSTILGFVANRLGIAFAVKIGLYSHPTARRRHGRPIPVSGGLWTFLSFVAGLTLFCILENSWAVQNAENLIRTLACMGGLTLLGYFDDSRILRVRSKFLAQLFVGLLALTIPTVGDFCEAFRPTFGIMTYPLVLTFMIGVVNAVNFIDGLDGLLSTTLFLCFASLIVRAHAFNHAEFVTPVLALALCSLAGFTFFNWTPAKIFMGDAGSMAFGFLLVVSCMIVGPSHHHTEWQGDFNEALSGVLQLGFPILDLLWVISKRILTGHSPFRADQNHLHHSLTRLGFSVSGCLLILFVFNLSLQITSFEVMSRSSAEAWPTLAVTGALTFLLITWIVSMDSWKIQTLAKTPFPPSSKSTAFNAETIHDFNLVINAQPLFEGQLLGNADQAMSAIRSLAFMLESNSPRGSQVLWLESRKSVCMFFPRHSVSTQDMEGLQARIQRLIDHWIEIFNVSISATTLRVKVGGPTDGAMMESALTLGQPMPSRPKDTAA